MEQEAKKNANTEEREKEKNTCPNTVSKKREITYSGSVQSSKEKLRLVMLGKGEAEVAFDII